MMLLLWLGSPQLAAFRLLRGDDDNNNNIEIGGWVGGLEEARMSKWEGGNVGEWRSEQDGQTVGHARWCWVRG